MGLAAFNRMRRLRAEKERAEREVKKQVEKLEKKTEKKTTTRKKKSGE